MYWRFRGEKPRMSGNSVRRSLARRLTTPGAPDLAGPPVHNRSPERPIQLQHPRVDDTGGPQPGGPHLSLQLGQQLAVADGQARARADGVSTTRRVTLVAHAPDAA